jgi:hypothetical protein
MKLRTITTVLAMLVVCAGLRAADDPLLGSWKLNLAQSKYDPGPAPTTSTINKYVPWGTDGVRVITDGTDAQGNPDHTEYSAQYDGKDYPVAGERDFDTVALQRIDPHTTLLINKKGGHVVRVLRRVVSKDGRTLTAAMVGVNARGQAFHNVTVYDRQ